MSRPKVHKLRAAYLTANGRYRRIAKTHNLYLRRLNAAKKRCEAANTAQSAAWERWCKAGFP